MRRLRPAWALLLGCALLGAGCTVGKEYRAPELPAPAAWTESAAGTSPGPAKDLARWWQVFGDPALNQLVGEALASAPDLKLAAARVREGRALRAVAAGGEWPQLEATAVAKRNRASMNGPTFLPGADPLSSLFQVGFDATWELDLFGAVRRGVEAADAELGAAEAGRRAVRVSLLAEVGRNYIDVRGFQHQLDVARANLAAQAEVLELTRTRYRAGLVGELDVDRATALLASTRAQVPTLEAGQRRALHRLAVLLGRKPGALVERLSAAAPIPVAPADVQVGLPSDLLRRRPDLKAAERRLAAATARVGVATADLYPRFSLSGAFGLQSGSLGDLAQATSRFWSVGPSVHWPIFQGGRIRANIEVQNAREEQALVVYEKQFLTALEEVDNALVAYGHEEVRREALAESVAAAKRAVEAARSLYESGLADFLQVLDAQRSLFAAQSELARSETAVSTDLVALYKALGGGWEGAESPASSPGG